MALALAEAKRLYGGGWGTLTTEEQAAILRGDGPLPAADDDDDDNDGDVVYVPTVWCDGIPPRGGGRATPVAARGAAPEEIGGVNFEEAIGALPSLVRFEVEREEGDHIDATVDLASCAGYAHLVHPDADAVERDYRALRALQDEGLFEVR